MKTRRAEKVRGKNKMVFVGWQYPDHMKFMGKFNSDRSGERASVEVRQTNQSILDFRSPIKYYTDRRMKQYRITIEEV